MWYLGQHLSERGVKPHPSQASSGRSSCAFNLHFTICTYKVAFNCIPEHIPSVLPDKLELFILIDTMCKYVDTLKTMWFGGHTAKNKQTSSIIISFSFYSLVGIKY